MKRQEKKPKNQLVKCSHLNLESVKRISKTSPTKPINSCHHRQHDTPPKPPLCPEPNQLDFNQLDQKSTLSEVEDFWQKFGPKVKEWNERRLQYCIQRTIYENHLQQLSKNPYDLTARKTWHEMECRIKERKHRHSVAVECNGVTEAAEVFSSYRVIVHHGRTLSSKFSSHLPLLLDLSGKYGHVTIYNSRVNPNSSDLGIPITFIKKIPCFKLVFSEIRFQIFMIVRPCASRNVFKHGSLLIGHRICLSSNNIEKVHLQTEPVGPDEAYYLITLKIETKVRTVEVVYFVTPNLGKHNAHVIHRYRTGPTMKHSGNELINILPVLPMKKKNLVLIRRPNISQILEQIWI